MDLGLVLLARWMCLELIDFWVLKQPETETEGCPRRLRLSKAEEIYCRAAASPQGPRIATIS